MNLTEKRKAERFTGAIQIELKEGSGITRDFSTEGVFFLTGQSLSLGEQLDFVMKLSYAHPSRTIPLRCRGEVVRIEPDLEKLGVAVAISERMLGGWSNHTVKAQ